MRTVAVVGYSESGKTRLVVRLIQEFRRRGRRAAAVKRCPHGFALDVEGKDTAAFGRAGADGVAMISPEGWAAFGSAPTPGAEALAARFFPDVDVLLIEGGKDVRGPRKIEVRRAGQAAEPAVRPDELLAVVADAPPSPGPGAPVFGPDDTAGLADLILSLEEDKMADITLEVDGLEVPLNPFVRTFIERTVLGMVTSLSGVAAEPAKISLVIDRTDEARRPGPKP